MLRRAHRFWLTFAIASLVLSRTSLVVADTPVPLALQAELLAKVAGYDRNMSERASGLVKIAIIQKGDDAESRGASLRLQSALAGISRVGGLPHEEIVLRFTTAAALAAECRAERYSIVYLSPGFGDEVGSIARALDGVSVLSAGTDPDYVRRGTVLGFDLVSGRAKVLVNLTQAQKQKVSLSSDLLRIATVVP